MFQRNQFRSSTTHTTTTTTTTTDSTSQKQRTLSRETNQANHLLPSFHNYQQSEKYHQVTSAPTNTLSSSSSHDRTNLPFRHSLLKSSWLRRIALTVATLRLTTTTSTTTTAAVTGSESIATLFKSLLATCYYAIAFTTLLILILYINRFAMQESLILNSNNIKSKSPFLGSSNMIESGDESNGSGFIALNYIHNEDEIKFTFDNYNNNSMIHLRSKRSPTNNLRKGVVNSSSNNNNNNHGNHPYGSQSFSTNSNHHRRSQGKTSARNNQLKIERQQEQHGTFSRLYNKTKPFHTTNELIKFDEHADLRANRYAIPRFFSTTSKSGVTTSNLPELSERQADFSLNNRGTLPTSSDANHSGSINNQHHLPTAPNQLPRESLTENSQWIPILVSSQESPSRNQAYVTMKPQLRKPVPINAGPSPNIELRKPPIQTVPPLPVNLIEATSHNIENNVAPKHDNYHYSRHRHEHHRTGSYRGRQWRRPRLNGYLESSSFGQRPGKLYKRVLLCDKTLVSLDYIKNSNGLEPPPPPPPPPPSLPNIPYPANHYHLDHSDDFDDNVIELDTNFEPVLAHSNNRRVNAQNKSILTSSSSVSPTPILSLPEAQILSESVKDDIMAIERRSLLTDEDPLVKCDMWDLEKGLKNRKPPKEILQMAVKADFDTVRDAINRCRQLSEKNLPPDDEYRDGIEILSTEDLISLFSMKRGLIPGTKWCGLGDQASSYNDLGPKHRIDICCRAHDHCPIRLKPFRNDYGVLNIALYTKSHCDCDADFYRCLREARSRTADMLGNLYFNVMKLQCMHEERLKICREMK